MSKKIGLASQKWKGYRKGGVGPEEASAVERTIVGGGGERGGKNY